MTDSTKHQHNEVQKESGQHKEPSAARTEVLQALNSKSGNELVALMRTDQASASRLPSLTIDGTNQHKPGPGEGSVVRNPSPACSPERKPGDGARPTIPADRKPEEPATKPEARSPQTVLTDRSAKAEDKLRAARELYERGQRTFTGPDDRSYQITSGKYGSKDGVVISTTDGNGKYMPVLRGLVDRQTGAVSHQRDSRGHEVDYGGDRAKKELPKDAVLSNANQGTDKPEQPRDKSEQPRDKVEPSRDKVEPPRDNPKPGTDSLPPGYELSREFDHGHLTGFGYPGEASVGKVGYKGHKLYSTDDVLSGKAPYASVALSSGLMEKIWTTSDRDLSHAPVVVSPALDKRYAPFLKAHGLEHFPLRAMDTGVTGQVVDIRVGSRAEASRITGPDKVRIYGRKAN